jgi:F-type H+-transporting ATPase subunit a
LANPSDQFIVKTLVPLRVGGLDLGFTNAALMMVLATAAIAGGLLFATRTRAPRCSTNSSRRR